MRRLRLALLAIAAAAVLGFFLFESRGMDRDEHSQGDLAVVALRAACDELERQALLARAEPARAAERIREAHGRAESACRIVIEKTQRMPSQALHDNVGSLRNLLLDVPGHAESLGRAGTEWIESLNSLPAKASRVPVAKLDADTISALHTVLSQLAALQASLVAEPSTAMATGIARLREKAKLNPKLAPPIEDFLATVDALVRSKGSMETEIAAVLNMGLARSGEGIHKLFEADFDSRLENAERFRIGLYVLSIALLGRLMQSMFELRKRTRELDDANRTLEERVSERTLKLQAANMALKVEIVERQRAEEEVQNALVQAEAASRTKSEFLANTSHEIRTPMTSILGFSERLLDPSLSDEEKVEAISRIRRNGEHLLQIINDILDISKIEAGMLSVEEIACSPHEILAEVHGAMDVRAAIAGIELKVESIGGIPETIRTDPVRLKQILINLVGNAIKFTQRGWVRLLVTLESCDPPRLRFAVMDTGIGMDAETVTRLFRPFMQADSSTTRKFGGTGLGLSICKHLVDRLGGTIEVTSEPGKGSVFTFSVDTGSLDGVKMLRGQNLSFLADYTESDTLLTTPRMRGARILLVEDGEDNRRLIGFLLSAAEATVEVAVDGREALAKVNAAEGAGSPYHLIVMDMQMPVLDGYEATRMLRQQGCQSAIVALTAHAMASDRDKCLAAGCDDFCTKPIVRHQFLGTIARWFEQKHGPAPPVNDSAPDRPDPAQQDAELLELVRMFVADLDTDVNDMRAALAAGDMSNLGIIAHRLKGAAGSYGFPSLTTHAGLLEKHVKAGAPREELERDLQAVQRLCEAAMAQHVAK